MGIRVPWIARFLTSERRLALACVVPVLCLFLAACGDDAPEAAHEVDEHAGEAGLFVVKAAEKGMPLSEQLSEEIQRVENVVRVEKYIRLRMEEFDVVGIEPPAPARIMTGQPDVHLIEAVLPQGVVLGEGESGDDAVFVGEAFAETFGVEPGGTLTLGDAARELTVAGTFSTDPASLSRTVLMPLATVQAIYDLGRTVTHFWVTVESPDATHDVIRAVQLALGDTVEVLARTER